MVTRQPAQRDIIHSQHLVVPTSNNTSLACLTSKNSSQLSIKEALLSAVFSHLIISLSHYLTISSHHPIRSIIPSSTSVVGGTPVQIISYYLVIIAEP